MTMNPGAFYTERLPAQFNRIFEEAQARGAEDRILRGLAAVDATLAVEVEGAGKWFLNIDSGVMTPGDAPAHAPFLTLRHDLDAFAALERESGDSALGFLGGMAGLGGEMLLTKQRIDNLRMVRGTVRFELTGEAGFTLITHFGEGPVQDEAACSLCVDADVYAQLRNQEIDAQEAFMSGRIGIEGDMTMAMQLALALLSPY